MSFRSFYSFSTLSHQVWALSLWYPKTHATNSSLMKALVSPLSLETTLKLTKLIGPRLSKWEFGPEGLNITCKGWGLKSWYLIGLKSGNFSSLTNFCEKEDSTSAALLACSDNSWFGNDTKREKGREEILQPTGLIGTQTLCVYELTIVIILLVFQVVFQC